MAILLQIGTPNAINATLYTNLSFNFVRDIAPVGSITRVAYVVVVHPSVPAKTIPEFIAEKWAKAIKFAHIKSDYGHAWRRSINPVPRIPCSERSFTKKDFGRGLPASRSVARETVHPIALGQAPLRTLAHQPVAGLIAECIVRSRRASSISGTSASALKPTRAGMSTSLAT
jgi:hypothetical protein